MSVTTSVSTLTSTLGWASHLLLSLSFLKAEVVVFFSSVMLLSFLFLRVTNQVPALSEVKIEGNRNNLGANLKDKKKSAKIRIFRHNWISYCSGSLERLIFLKAARGSFLLVDDLTSHWSKSEASKREVGIFIVEKSEIEMLKFKVLCGNCDWKKISSTCTWANTKDKLRVTRISKIQIN